MILLVDFVWMFLIAVYVMIFNSRRVNNCECAPGSVVAQRYPQDALAGYQSPAEHLCSYICMYALTWDTRLYVCGKTSGEHNRDATRKRQKNLFGFKKSLMSTSWPWNNVRQVHHHMKRQGLNREIRGTSTCVLQRYEPKALETNLIFLN